MSTSTFVGNSDGLVTGLCPTPPPPPPPPPVPGQVPAMRINTAEPPTIRRPQMASNDAYEPPAAIQNAMLTKDKKPFTYTPGMGGKLDLSQIRSPRMARRVAKNANDEGIEGPPKSALEPRPTPAANTGASLFVQPQVAIPVFPTSIPVQTAANRTPPTPPTPPVNRTQPSTPEKQPESPKAVAKVETKVTPVITIQPNTPESPSTPTQVTLTKAPTPWLQNKNKPQEELPEWAKRSTANKQSVSSPDSPVSPPIYAPIQQTPPPQPQQQPPQWQQAQKQQPIQPRPQSMPQQQTQQRPVQIQPQQMQPQQFNQQQKRPYSSPPIAQQPSQQTQQERVIPIRIEDRPSVFDVKPEAGHHQFKQPSPHHQQRWGQPTVQSQTQNQPQQPAQPQPSSAGGFIIPIMMEGNEKKPVGGTNSYSQPIVRNNAPVVENQTVKVPQQRIIPVQIQQSDSGPVQSRSFRVLQKITDTDHANDVDTEQMRKLQLTDDDRILMNKFKEQVDNDCSLHHEEDPRYRGAAIPSRAFRFLQTMTDSGEVPVMNPMQRPQSAINKKQNRNSKNFEETQANLPPSEQQVQEPKKYMGSAIPSRSFRILQAMTAPESVATQENRQADYHCQTENNVPGNQQGVFLPPCPPPFWTPESGWWGYYPLPYPNISNDAYPYHPDNTAYIYFPIYNQNYPYPQHDPTSNKNAYPGVYAPYIVPVPPQNGGNCNRNCGPVGDNVTALKTDPTAAIPAIPENAQDDNVAGGKVSLVDDDVDGPRQWDRPNSMSRTASNTSKDSDCTTAMNITDEEEIPEEIIAPQSDEAVQLDRVEKKANGSLNVTVPNYTYIDTSDSSDSSDSESQSDNESVIESSKSSSDSNSDDSSSDSDDSDSYLAYSTGLNPHGRSEKDNERNSTGNSSSKESCNEGQASEPSSKNNTDCESDAEEQLAKETERTDASTFPHQLSVIYEDVERPDSASPRPQEGRSVRGSNETPFEATDDPPDDSLTDAPTVSVSLPLRFKFSVSENNEDVTTVIVGDSTIKPERGYIKEESRSTKTQEKVDEVSADFLVKNANVNFTVKKETSDGKRKGKGHPSERIKEGTAVENKVKDTEDPVVPHVNFTLRKIPTRFSKINCEETVETEFTIRRKTSAKKEETRTNKQEEVRVNDGNVRNSDDPMNKSSPNKDSNSTYIATVKETSSKTRDFNSNILKPEVIVSDCNWPEEPSTEPSDNFQSPNSKRERDDVSQGSNSDVSKKESKNEEYADEKLGKETKHLLSVQNSRDETDDEDSGVTSDMSRMISEADTDSECTSSRNMRKYQRTQTHSRLFRLLNDDSILPEGAEKTNDSSSGREYLSLPLKNTSFNYDENYCSNYSSGVTSPEYSPVGEQSWRRLHDAENSLVPDQHGDVLRQGHSVIRHDRASSKEDPYYQAWKTTKCPTPSMDHDVVPSMAFKVLESKRPLWSYKVNVLCPRIKSTKSVPRTLQAGRQTDSIVSSSPNPTSQRANLKTDHC